MAYDDTHPLAESKTATGWPGSCDGYEVSAPVVHFYVPSPTVSSFPTR